MAAEQPAPAEDPTPYPAGCHERLGELFRADPHARATGIEIVDFGLGWCDARVVTLERHANFIGPVHGGVVFSLADVALSVAGNSWGRISLALSLEVLYAKATRVGQDVVARARCRTRSRRIAAFSVDVEADGVLVATLQALNYRTDDWHLGADAWPESWRSTY